MILGFGCMPIILIISPMKSHLQAILHVHCHCELWGHGVVVDDLDMVMVEDGGSNKLHLIVSEVFAEAESWATVEGRELVSGFAPIPAISQPPLWFELPAVFSPDALHPSHGIDCVYHS